MAIRINGADYELTAFRNIPENGMLKMRFIVPNGKLQEVSDIFSNIETLKELTVSNTSYSGYSVVRGFGLEYRDAGNYTADVTLQTDGVNALKNEIAFLKECILEITAEMYGGDDE